MDRNTPTQRHTHVPDGRVLQPAAARRMQKNVAATKQRCSTNEKKNVSATIKFKHQVNKLPVELNKDEKTAPQLRQATSLRHG